MPNMWFAKDGARPSSQSGLPTSITQEEAVAIAESYRIVFVGQEPPSINPDKPSYSLKNVVFEIESSAQLSSPFPNVGFYLISGLTPEEAQQLLRDLRTNTSDPK